MNKYKKIYYAICIILTLLYIYLVIFSFSVLNNTSKVNLNMSMENDINIILDAGHGGEDGGAVVNNIVEKDLNLSITLKLADLFKSAGFNVTLTRDSDNFVNASGDTLRERKISDMRNRLSIFNQNNQNIVISIHQNKFSQEKYKGTQIFFSVNNNKSEILSRCIQKSIIDLIQPTNKRECKKADNNIYLLKNTVVPAILIECGFISNNEEAVKLQNEDYQKQLAFAIFTGFMEYYNN